MNYTKIYTDLIISRKNRILEEHEYYETHHILPLSMGGKNNEDNLVKLTLREHLLSHWLLWRIHRDSSTGFAFSRISKRVISIMKIVKINCSNKIVHKEASEAHSFANKNKKSSLLNKEISELRKNIKRSYTLSVERKEQIKIFFQNFKRTPEQNKKIGESNAKSLRGRKMTDDEKHIRNHKEKTVGKKRTDETKNKIKFARINMIPKEDRLNFINQNNIIFSTDNVWMKTLSVEWNISESAVRHWIKTHLPERYYNAN